VTEPKTLAEQLDAAQTGEEFGGVLMGLFGYLEQARDEPDEPAECGDYFDKWKRFCTEPEGHEGLHRNACVSWEDQ
jgi:hypothetical protein